MGFGDAGDWIFKTSANFVGGSSTARQIMEQLFTKHYESVKNQRKKMKKAEKNLSEKLTTAETPTDDHLTTKKIPEKVSFENFDESQHLNGCPMKWLYNKKSLERSRKYKMVRWCSKKMPKEKENKRERNQNVEEKTTSQVKIHKINLIEKYSFNNEENRPPYYNEGFLERKRKKRKNEWKYNDDDDDSSEEICQLETFSDIGGRHNFLPPRPLLGLNPLLSVLMAPQTESKCCSVRELSKIKPSNEKKMVASLTIQSLDLPFFPPEAKLGPKTIHSSRWGAKTNRVQKKLQIPNQITINLRQTKKTSQKSENELRVFSGKKISEKAKQAKSLSTLFYELKDKANNREEPMEYLEGVIQDMGMVESLFKIKKFLNLRSEDRIKCFPEKKSDIELLVPKINMSQLNLVCGRAKFFEKNIESRKVNRQINFKNKNVLV